MSRYIDADTLMQDAVQEYGIAKSYFNAIKRMVSNAPTIETKQIKYFDEDEKVWKLGSIIVEHIAEPQPDCAWK